MTALHKGEHSESAHTGLVIKLLAGLSPAPLTTRGLLMAFVIIPHVLSIPRWLGRRQRLTRRSRLPVSLGSQAPAGAHAVCASTVPHKEKLVYRASMPDQSGVPGVISRKFSVREIATKSLLVARNDYICKNNTFCYTLLHTPREMQPYWAAKPGVSRQIRGHRNHLIHSQL